ncbi:MAG: hypothetical protein KDD82_20625 [Planctomycetes bacterium]|nr:hypothetical protein [Planctomycetota bacterium]
MTRPDPTPGDTPRWARVAAWSLRRAAWFATTRRGRRSLAWAGVTIAFGLASGEVRAAVEARDEFCLRRDCVQVANTPEGLSAESARDLERLPLPLHPQAFDERLVPYLHGTLSQLPWVREVRDLRLEGEHELRFTLRVRKPLARLGAEPHAPVLTRDGAVISSRYVEDPAALPAVLGVPGPERPEARLEALRAAIEVLRATEDATVKPDRVDVSNLGGADPLGSEVVLEVGDTRIDWGRAPSSPGWQRSVADKLADWERFLREGPALETCAHLSLRWDDVSFMLRTEPAAPR